jgi:hypothetical protein
MSSRWGAYDAVFKHKSMTVRGKFEISDKQRSLDRIAYYKGGKMLYQINPPNGTRYQEGYDGALAWQLDRSGKAGLSEGNEIKSKARDADMYYPCPGGNHHVCDLRRCRPLGVRGARCGQSIVGQ